MNKIPEIITWAKNQKNYNFESLCESHKVSGLLYKIAPQEFISPQYENAWKNQWLQNEIHNGQLKTLGEILDQNNIQATLLKGMAIVSATYPDSGCRFMSDIDILIETKSLQKVEEILISLDFELIKEEKWRANDFKCVWEKKHLSTNIYIEVHTKLFYHVENENWMTKPSNILGLNILSNEDQILHLFGHLAFQHTFLKLYWSFDISLLLKKEEFKISWPVLIKKAKSYQLLNSLKSSLWILQKHFGNNELNKIINENNLAPNIFLKFCLSKKLLWNNSQNGFTYYLTKHLLKDSLGESLKYDFFWLLNKLKKKLLLLKK